MLKCFKQNLLGKGKLNPSHSYKSDIRDIKRCPESEEGLQVFRTTPEEQHRGIPVTPHSGTDSSEAQPKYWYENTLSIRSEQKVLEIHARLQGYYLIDTVEPWWLLSWLL